MDWKYSSLQIGSWLGLGQLPKRSSLHLNTKLPVDSCSNDQLHLRRSLPMASPQRVAHKPVCMHTNCREKEGTG